MMAFLSEFERFRQGKPLLKVVDKAAVLCGREPCKSNPFSRATSARRSAYVGVHSSTVARPSDVRITIHAGEPGASVPHVRQHIEEAWGARCFDHAGATEVGAWGFQCQENAGVMHLNEAEFVFQVINPASGKPVSKGRGELVITGLGRLGIAVAAALGETATCQTAAR